MRTRAVFLMLVILLAPIAVASEVGFNQENALGMDGLNIQTGEVSPVVQAFSS